MCPQATDPASPDPPPAEYPEIKGYRILGVLGEGAVGTVFKARRVDTGVAVALKILHALGPKRSKHIARLVKEGRVIARLNHPGIVKGLDVGESGGLYYIAMELVAGKSIRDHLEAGRIFTESETLDLAEKAVRALHHAARQGVIHRDIKPANLMLALDGKVKITDLGLAKDAVDLSLTRSDATVGTPQYISPEQARDSQAVDVRSDIFSLGATLYHMVCGQPPFSAGSLAEIITKVLYETEDPVERLNPALSAPFSKLLRRMLAKDPEDRYPNYVELMADLDRVRAGRDIQAPIRRDRSAPGGWKHVATAAAALTAVALVMFVWRPWRTPAEVPEPTPPVARSGADDPTPAPPPVPAAWEAKLAEVRAELQALVQRERFEEVQTRLDLERSRFIRMGEAAKDALLRLEEEIRRKIGVLCRGALTARVNALRSALGQLGDPPGPGAFRGIRVKKAAIDEMIRDLPNLLEVDFGAEFEDELDEIEEHARNRAETLVRHELRRARRLADDGQFVSANRTILALRTLDADVFFPQVGPMIEAFRDDLEALRRKAKARYEQAYRMFQAGLESRLARWQYQQADLELTEFERRLKPWQAEAPGESQWVGEMAQHDRSDYRGVMRIWTLARKRLASLIKMKQPVRLSFGKESSRKVIVELEGETYPEQIKVRFRVGGRAEVLENRLSHLTTEHVIEQLAVKAEKLETRWLALFYFFAAKRPDLHPEQAKLLLDRAEENFAAAGGAGLRYRPRIDALRRDLNATEQERRRLAQQLHEKALADFQGWEFSQARAKWLRMQDRFSTVFKSKAEYRDYLKLAERCEPLERLKRRFPGARREHLHRERDHELAFRLTFPFRPNADLGGIEYAWESWELGPEGLARVIRAGTRPRFPFPREWGLRVPIALNYKHSASVTVTLKADAEEVMSLFCISLGGNIAGLLNLDGFNDRPSSIRPNQLSLWTSAVFPRRSGFDVFKDYENHFQLPVLGNNVSPGLDYRFQLGKIHKLTLRVSEKNRLLSFSADGTKRLHQKVGRVRSIEEIEIRAWNSPIVLKELVVEGVLSR